MTFKDSAATTYRYKSIPAINMPVYQLGSFDAEAESELNNMYLSWANNAYAKCLNGVPTTEDTLPYGNASGLAFPIFNASQTGDDEWSPAFLRY